MLWVLSSDRYLGVAQWVLHVVLITPWVPLSVLSIDEYQILTIRLSFSLGLDRYLILTSLEFWVVPSAVSVGRHSSTHLILQSRTTTQYKTSYSSISCWEIKQNGCYCILRYFLVRNLKTCLNEHVKSWTLLKMFSMNKEIKSFDYK